MNTEILRLKYTDATFTADVDRSECEAVIRYKGDFANEFRLSLQDLHRFAEFINQIAKEEPKWTA